jgi:PAS domain S-box-containing protein
MKLNDYVIHDNFLSHPFVLNNDDTISFMVDKHGKIVLTSLSKLNSSLFLRGKSIKNILPDIWPKVKETLHDRKDENKLIVQLENEKYFCHLSRVELKDDITGVLCILHRLASRKHNYYRILKEFYSILNSVDDGIWISDAKGNLHFVNRAAERINGLKAGEIVGKNMRELEEAGIITKSITIEVIKTGSKVNSFVRNKIGRKLMTTGIPITDDNDRLLLVLVIERYINEFDRLYLKLQEQEAFSEKIQHELRLLQHVDLESKRIIAKSPQYVQAMKMALKLGPSQSTVLILGDSGTGKEIFADLIHKYSNRSNKPMIKINCGAIPDGLIESELFGYSEGAFTGAIQNGKPGYFEIANGSTIFLDEIGELPLISQVKILRFLDDGSIRRIGSRVARNLNVRIIAASNRDLKEMVDKGKFRLDLYYRLNVVPIRIPPLKERRDCILPLYHYYLEYFSSKNGKKKRFHFSKQAVDALLAYSYPGNVRELINICEFLLLTSEKEFIGLENLPNEILRREQKYFNSVDNMKDGSTLKQIMESYEREVLENTIEKYGVQTEAAKVLGISQSSISRKMNKYKIDF